MKSFGISYLFLVSEASPISRFTVYSPARAEIRNLVLLVFSNAYKLRSQKYEDNLYHRRKQQQLDIHFGRKPNPRSKKFKTSFFSVVISIRDFTKFWNVVDKKILGNIRKTLVRKENAKNSFAIRSFFYGFKVAEFALSNRCCVFESQKLEVRIETTKCVCCTFLLRTVVSDILHDKVWRKR